MATLSGLQVLVVFLGAGLGGVCRYLAGVWLVQPTWLPFAFSTFAVNAAGGLLAGVLFALLGATQLKESVTGLFLMTGFLGGLTTFSAFTAENALLIVDRPFDAVMQILAHVLSCLIAWWVGFKVFSIMH
ncbi:MAG: CrcB family protein [Limnobacter sp.]|nr:CrcB family protein [Limnobacter sp.]